MNEHQSVLFHLTDLTLITHRHFEHAKIGRALRLKSHNFVKYSDSLDVNSVPRKHSFKIRRRDWYINKSHKVFFSVGPCILEVEKQLNHSTVRLNFMMYINNTCARYDQ